MTEKMTYKSDYTDLKRHFKFIFQVPGLVNRSQLKEGKEGSLRLIGQVK